MEKIGLYDILINYGYPEGGGKVFEIANRAILKNEVVIIDMIHVASVPTNFMNTSFGALMDIYGVEKTKRAFKFRNILRSQIEKIRKYFDDYEMLLESHSYKK